MKNGYLERMEIVGRVKSGEGISEVSRTYHVHKRYVLAWVRLYDRYGLEGIKKGGNCCVTSEEKEAIVRLILEKGVPLSHVSIEKRVSVETVKHWIRKVREHGYASLREKKKRGRPSRKAMGRPKKKEPQTEVERLQVENLRLRAENALLKKVIALVGEKKARARQNGQKPSTN